jgi:hypothetical protein
MIGQGGNTMKIDESVPIPKSRNSYRWGDMNVGDSVFYDNEPAGSVSNQAMASKTWGQKYNAKFSARKEGNGVRIWRTA